MVALYNTSVTRTNNTSLKDVWQTPTEILDMIHPINVDPCAGEDTNIGIDANYDKSDDGLSKKWHGRVFVNPPFSQKGVWLEKVIKERSNTDCIFVLTPDSTDTKSWWHNYIAEEADYVWFSRGRIAYINPETGEKANNPTFGTAISVFGEPEERTVERLASEGHLLQTV